MPPTLRLGGACVSAAYRHLGVTRFEHHRDPGRVRRGGTEGKSCSEKLMLAAGVALALLAPAYAADPQTFGDEAKATAFCKTGNVVWFNPASKIYFAPGSQFYGKTKAGGFTCKALAEKAGFRESKGN